MIVLCSGLAGPFESLLLGAGRTWLVLDCLLEFVEGFENSFFL